MRRLSRAQRDSDESDQLRTVELTHHGRKTGKAYTVKVWFVRIDGYYWVGSLNANGSWVHNVRASGHAHLDFGNGQKEYKCYWVANTRELERFSRAIRRKYPVLSRMIRLIQRKGKQVAFRLEPVI